MVFTCNCCSRCIQHNKSIATDAVSEKFISIFPGSEYLSLGDGQPCPSEGEKDEGSPVHLHLVSKTVPGRMVH